MAWHVVKTFTMNGGWLLLGGGLALHARRAGRAAAVPPIPTSTKPEGAAV